MIIAEISFMPTHRQGLGFVWLRGLSYVVYVSAPTNFLLRRTGLCVLSPVTHSKRAKEKAKFSL